VKIIFLCFVLFFECLYAQNLSSERILKLIGRKRSIYLTEGIFHHISKDISKYSLLKGVRTSYVSSRGYERIVFDFSSSKPPKIYGHISEKRKKIYIDFMNSGLDPHVNVKAKIKYADNIDFFNLDKNNISVEISYSGKLNFEVFYLENPGRLVLDIKQ